MAQPGAYNTPPGQRIGASQLAAQEKSTNVTWHTGHIGRDDRGSVLGHGAALVWLTGLSGSGKSTVGNALEQALVARGVHAYVLDGDNVRHGLNGDLGFSPADRTENIRRIGEVAKLFVDSGAVVITAFISPYRADRDAVRGKQVDPGDFVEVYVDCPLDVCEARDPKGLYKKARAGEIRDFTGISAPYEAPSAPEVVVNTHEQSLEQNVQAILDYLVGQGIIPK